MIKVGDSLYTATMNPDLEILINHFDFFIYEHSYVEFKNKRISQHDNRIRDNANLLYYIMEGGGWIEGKDFHIPIRQGNIYFYPCVKKVPYQSVFLPGTKKAVVSFYFNLFSHEDIFSKMEGPRFFSDERNLTPLIREAILSPSPSKQLLLPSLVKLSIAPLFQEVQDIVSDRLTKGKQYSDLFEYIDRNLTIDLTLKTISRNTGISISSLTHTFPQNIGFTVKKYIQKNILKRVCLNLAYTELQLKEIAYQYRFSSEAYFSEWFYKLYKIRPNQYRKIFKNFTEYQLYQPLSENKLLDM